MSRRASHPVTLPVFFAAAARVADTMTSDQEMIRKGVQDRRLTKARREALSSAARGHEWAQTADARSHVPTVPAALVSELETLRGTLAVLPEAARATVEGMIADREDRVARIEADAAAENARFDAMIISDEEMAAAMAHVADKVAGLRAKPNHTAWQSKAIALFDAASEAGSVDVSDHVAVGTLRWLVA